MERMTPTYVPRQTVGLAAGAMLAFVLFSPLGAQQAPPAGVCRVTGRATGGAAPPPRVGIPVKVGDTVQGITSTETRGRLGPTLTPGTSPLSAGLTRLSPVPH